MHQTHARHILLRPSAQLRGGRAEAPGRIQGQIRAGTQTFEQLARKNSEDGNAARAATSGWTWAGTFVPEFEETMNALQIGGISEPIVSRFGVHLIQVSLLLREPVPGTFEMDAHEAVRNGPAGTIQGGAQALLAELAGERALADDGDGSTRWSTSRSVTSTGCVPGPCSPPARSSPARSTARDVRVPMIEPGPTAAIVSLSSLLCRRP